MNNTIEDGLKVTPFIWKNSGCDLKKGNDTQKKSCVKPTPSEFAVLTFSSDNNPLLKRYFKGVHGKILCVGDARFLNNGIKRNIKYLRQNRCDIVGGGGSFQKIKPVIGNLQLTLKVILNSACISANPLARTSYV